MKTTSSLLLTFFFAIGALADYPEEWEGVLYKCSWFDYPSEMGVFNPKIKMYVWPEDIDGDGDTDLWVSSEWGQNGRLGLTWHPFIWTGEQFEPRLANWKNVPLEVAQGAGEVVEIDYERGYPQELLEEAKPQTNFADRVEALWAAKDFWALGRLALNRKRLDPDDLAALLIQTELTARWASFSPPATMQKALEIGAKTEGEHFKAVYSSMVEYMAQMKAMYRQRQSEPMRSTYPTAPTFPWLPFLRALEEDGYFLRGLPLAEVKGGDSVLQERGRR